MLRLFRGGNNRRCGCQIGPRESYCASHPSYNERLEIASRSDRMPTYQENDIVIISAVRTPVGKFQGSLTDLSAVQLGAITVREAVKRAQVDPKQVDEC